VNGRSDYLTNCLLHLVIHLSDWLTKQNSFSKFSKTNLDL
jgi:hypothetical protein